MNHVYMDESTAKRYLLAAVVIPQSDLYEAKSLVQEICRGKPFHMKNERDQNRHRAAQLIGQGKFRVNLYDAGTEGKDEARRARCLTQAARDLRTLIPLKFWLDYDAELKKKDAVVLFRCRDESNVKDWLTWEHAKAFPSTNLEQQRLLVLPDAVAWAWARGGRFKEAVAPVVDLIEC